MRLFFILPIIALVLAGCTNEYYVEAYKSEAEISSQNENLLKSRFTEVEFDGFRLFLEWYTYDNKTINRAPYKLFVVIEPKNSSFDAISIESININSNLNIKYEISPKIKFPVVLSNKGALTRSSYTFEPAFDFRFKKKEVIETEIRVKVLGSGNVEMIKHKWFPIRVKHYAPII